MQTGVTAYEAVALQTANLRELEAKLLLKAGSRLQAVHDSWDRKRGELDDALLFNRRLWSLFLDSVTTGKSPLPPGVRQNVANLGLFVMNHTLTALTDPRPEQLGSLIAINREVAAGLMGRAA